MQKKKEVVSDVQFVEYINQLKQIGIQKNINETLTNKLKNYFDQKKYAKMLAIIMGYFNLDTKVSIKFDPDKLFGKNYHWFEKRGLENVARMFYQGGVRAGIIALQEPAKIFISPALPRYDETHAFKNFVTKIEIWESMKYESFQSFAYCIAHEMAHLSLYSRRHELRKSDIATDLLVLVQGFSEIFRIGRKSSNGLAFGYLSDKQFETAYHMIRLMRKDAKISEKIGSQIHIWLK